MADPVFVSLMTHRADIVKAFPGTGDYGHKTLDWTTLATRTNVQCRLTQGLFIVPFTNEQNVIPYSGTVVGDFWLYMSRDEAPSSLLLQGAETTHRIENAIDSETGVVIGIGPFDIQAIQVAGGTMNHIKMLLRRIT